MSKEILLPSQTGFSGKSLITDGSKASWGLPAISTAACRVYNDAAQSVPDITNTLVSFNTELFDTDAIHDPAAPTTLTCKTAGIYLITAQVNFDTNATGARTLQIKHNNTTIIAMNSVAGATRVNVSTVYRLAVNDFLIVVAYQNSGGALNITASSRYSPDFSMVKIG